MPSWSSLEAFGRDLDRLRDDLEREEARRITRNMAERGQKIAEAEASRDLGGDPKFSGWKPTLDTQVKSLRDAALITPTKTSAGPWTVANDGRHADGGVGRFQGPALNMRTGRTTRRRDTGTIYDRRRRKGVRWNGQTNGKGTADRAVARMERELPEIAGREVRRVVAKRFDVS